MKTQNRLFILITIAALAFGATAQAANVAPFVRAGAEYTKFQADTDFDHFTNWEVGAAIEGGVVIAGAHSIGIEISYVESKSTVADSPIFKIKKQQMPIMAAYRYTYPLSNVFSVYGGLTAGLLMDKYSLDTTNAMSSGSATNWVPAVGVIAGINLRIGGGWHLNVGVRVLEIWQKTYDGLGNGWIGTSATDFTPIYTGKHLSVGTDHTYVRPTFTLGLGYKW